MSRTLTSRIARSATRRARGHPVDGERPHEAPSVANESAYEWRSF